MCGAGGSEGGRDGAGDGDGEGIDGDGGKVGGGGARIADQSRRKIVSTVSTSKPSVWPLYSASIMIGATSSV